MRGRERVRRHRAVIDALQEARIGDIYSDAFQQVWVEVLDPNITQLLEENHISFTPSGITMSPIVCRLITPGEMDLMARIAGLRRQGDISEPSEATMLFAGFNVSKGEYSLLAVTLVGSFANLVGSWIAYAIGYYGRIDVLEKHGKKLHIKPSHLKWADDWFAKYGDAFVPRRRLQRAAFPWRLGVGVTVRDPDPRLE